MMSWFKRLYCKARMVAYVNGELTPEVRRRVSRYIDDCPACYAEYRRQRDIQRELSATLPTFGKPTAGQLDRVWSNIQQEMTHRPHRPHKPMLSMRLGLATLGIMLILLTPLMFGEASASPAPAMPPTPAATLVAVATDIPQTRVPAITTEPQAERAEWIEVTDSAVAAVITPAAAITPDQDDE